MLMLLLLRVYAFTHEIVYTKEMALIMINEFTIIKRECVTA